MRAVTGGLVALLCLVLPVAARGQDVGFANAWPELTPADQEQVQKFGEDVKTFLGQAKSEMLFVRSATQFAESNGFRKWDAAAAAGLKPGSRWYAINRDRTIVLFVVGAIAFVWVQFFREPPGERPRGGQIVLGPTMAVPKGQPIRNAATRGATSKYAPIRSGAPRTTPAASTRIDWVKRNSVVGSYVSTTRT